MTTRTIKAGPLFRHVHLERNTIDEESRTVEFSFSSEEPYERWFGVEVLDHSEAAVRMARMAAGTAPLLRNHDPAQHIGVIERAWLGPDRRGRAVARFGRSAMAEEAFQDARDGVLVNVSVGYRVNKMKHEGKSNGIDLFRVTDWEPLEASLVAVPADPTVGLGRGAESGEREIEVESAAEPEPTAEQRSSEPAPAPVLRIETRDHPMTTQTTDQNQAAAGASEGERAFRAAAQRLGAIAEAYAEHGAREILPRALSEAWTAERFQEAIMERLTSRHSDTSGAHIGMSTGERQRYSLLRAIQAHMSGNWQAAGLERSANEALSQRLGRPAEGFYVPLDVFQRDFTAGTATEAGNLIATDLATDMFADVLRNRLVLGQLGCTILAGLSSNVKIPRKSVAGTVAMLTEVATAAETQPTTTSFELSPKRASAYVEVSKQAIIQGSMDIEAMVRQDLVDGTAVLFENQALNGSGSSPNMRGLRNQTGIGSVVGGTNGATIGWSHVVDLESACANVNAEPDTRAGYLTNTKVRGKAKQVQKATNLPFLWDGGAQPLNGYRAAVTNNMPSNLTKGSASGVCSSIAFASDWSMAVFAMFGALDVTVDPYTLATSGMVRLTVNAYGDFGLRLPACFAVADDILTS